jgi:hypothetical protein
VLLEHPGESFALRARGAKAVVSRASAANFIIPKFRFLFFIVISPFWVEFRSVQCSTASRASVRLPLSSFSSPLG